MNDSTQQMQLAAYRLMRGAKLLAPPGCEARIRSVLPPGGDIESLDTLANGWTTLRATKMVPMEPPAVDEPRVIGHSRYQVNHAWDVDAHLSAGDHGVVFTGDSSYHTAFFEATLNQPRTFIRGEGATIDEAEDKAWGQYQQVTANDHVHEFEPRQHRNGAGFCKHCGLFQPKVFTPEQLNSYCDICGVGTFWCSIGDRVFCRDHKPTNIEERRLLREKARQNGERVSELDELFDELGS